MPVGKSVEPLIGSRPSGPLSERSLLEPGAKSLTDFLPTPNFEESHQLCGLATVRTYTNSAYG